MGLLTSSHIPITMCTVGSQPIVTIQLGCQGLLVWVSISSEPKWPLSASWPDEEGDRGDLVLQEKVGLREAIAAELLGKTLKFGSLSGYSLSTIESISYQVTFK